MLISIKKLLNRYKLNIKGILHIGAHECEELNDYIKAGINKNNIIWIEGNVEIVNKMKLMDIKNIYHGLISDKEEDVEFIITNNGQSSSILELETHKYEHPDVYEIKRKIMKTTTIEKLLIDNDIYIPFNFVNIDIQGAELKALKGMQNILPYIDYIYTEVNIKYLYKNCALLKELDDFLNSFGFLRVDTKMTPHGWGDAFYIKL